MGKLHPTLPAYTIPWLGSQRMFWVATAPLLSSGRVNVSPKCAEGTFHVINEGRVWYEDLTGSGGLLLRCRLLPGERKSKDNFWQAWRLLRTFENPTMGELRFCFMPSRVHHQLFEFTGKVRMTNFHFPTSDLMRKLFKDPHLSLGHPNMITSSWVSPPLIQGRVT